MKIYKKHIYIGLAVIAVVITAIVILGNSKNSSPQTDDKVDTKIENNTQIIDVTAKSGGYAPRTIQATAGVASKLIITSDNSYGCERAFRIPSLGVSKTLPTQGVTEIDIPAQDAGKKITGTCSMGMYSFTINFK